MAAAEVQAQFDPVQLAEVARELRDIPDGVNRAAAGAINKAVAKAQTRMIRAVRDRVNLKAEDVRDRMRQSKALPSRLEGVLQIKRKGVPLIAYGARMTRQGVTVAVRKNEGRELLRHAFVATMPSGHQGVFERAKLVAFGSLAPQEKREFKAGQLHFTRSRLVAGDAIANALKRVGRLPIQQRYGPTALGVIEGAPGLLDKELELTEEELSVQLASQVDRFLQRRRIDRGSDDAS